MKPHHLLLPGALGLTLAAPLSAGVLLQNDFESETPGSFPATGFTDINQQGIRFAEDDTTATPFGPGNQYFHLGGANLRVATALPGGQINQLVQLGFDLVEPSGIGTSPLLFGFAANVTSLDLNDNAAYAFSLNNGTLTPATNTAVESGSLPTLTEDSAYRLEFTLNRTGATAEYPDPSNPANPPLTLDDGRLALWIRDIGAGTWAGPVILSTTQVGAPVEFLFRGFSTYDNELYIDNLLASDAGMWDGEGLDGLWATAANWTGDTVPSTGDALVFGASPDNFLTNDLAPGESFSGIRFLSSAGGTIIDGSSITLTGPVVSQSTAGQVLALPLALGTDLEVRTEAGDLFFDGEISGSFGVEKTGPGTAFLTNSNSYTGTTTISAGTLSLGDGSFDGSVAGPIVNNATLALRPIGDLDLASDISGIGDLLISTPGTIRLTGTNTYTGETLIGTGTLLLDSGSDLPAGSPLAFDGTGGTLDLDSKTLTAPSLVATSSAAGLHAIVGTGSLTVTGDNLAVGPGNGTAPGDSVTLDLAGLSAFTYDNAVGIVSVGNQVVGGNGRTGVLALADLSQLTAERIRIQDVGSGTSSACAGVLELGADTTLHTDEIEIAHSGRDSGHIEFRSDLSAGSLTLRAADGTGRAAIDIGRRNSSFHATHQVGIDLVSGGAVSSTLDALVSSLIVGDLGFGNSAVQHAFFRMGGGSLDATSIQLGKMLNSGTSGTLNSTFSLDGGDVIVPTLSFGENTSVDGALNARFELQAGTLTATTLQPGATTSTGSSTRVLVLGGGTLANTPGADLAIEGITLAIPAGAAPTLAIEAGQAATLGTGAAIRFGIDSSTATSGTLSLSGELVLGVDTVLTLEDEATAPLTPGTRLTLIDDSAGTLTGTFVDAFATPIADGDLITVGPNVFEIDYDDPLGGVTLTVDQSFDFESFTYDVGDRLGNTALSNDGWTGDDLAAWQGSVFSGDTYARNTNDGNDRITRTNDAGFGYGIPADAISVSLDITARTNGNFWSATLTAAGGDLLGLGYDGPADKFFILDGATRIDEAGATFTTGDVNLTARLVVDLVNGTADLIYDPDGLALVAIDDAPITATAATLASADGLGMRTTSRFCGIARYELSVTSPAGGTGPSAYESWATGFGLDPLGNGAPGEDPDGDGDANLVEFATNGNPTSGAASGKVAGLVQDVGGEEVLTLTLPVRGSGTPFSGATELVSAAVDGIIYRIQGSDDLTDWTTTAISEISPALDTGLPALDAGWEYRTFRTPDTLATDPEDFIRALIEAAP